MKEENKKKKSKYGRKPLPEGEKRQIEICILVNSEEEKALKTKFGDDNLRGKMREFLLNSRLKSQNKADPMEPFDQSIVFQLKRIGGNLNQLLFAINRSELPIEGETEEIIKELLEYITNHIK